MEQKIAQEKAMKTACEKDLPPKLKMQLKDAKDHYDSGKKESKEEKPKRKKKNFGTRLMSVD